MLVIVLIVVMVNLGFWQLRRLDQKTELNDTIRSRSAQPTVDVATIGSESDVDWRRVGATGTYRSADELVVSNRAVNGEPGFWVMTPLVLRDGSTVAVARGFIYRQEFEGRGLSGVPAPAGEVTVEGLLQKSPTNGRFGEERAATGKVPAISQADTGALGERWGGAVVRYWLRVESGAGAPAKAGPLYPIPAPPLSRGSHLSYAVQWFIFSMVGLFGYPVVLRRRAHAGDEGPDYLDPADRPGHPLTNFE